MASNTSDTPASHDTTSSLVVDSNVNIHMDVRMAGLSLQEGHGGKKKISEEKRRPDPTAAARFRARKEQKELKGTQEVIANSSDGTISGMPGIDVVGYYASSAFLPGELY